MESGGLCKVEEDDAAKKKIVRWVAVFQYINNTIFFILQHIS
jgi:hypothetical protein